MQKQTNSILTSIYTNESSIRAESPPPYMIQQQTLQHINISGRTLTTEITALRLAVEKLRNDLEHSASYIFTNSEAAITAIKIHQTSTNLISTLQHRYSPFFMTFSTC